MRRPRAASSPPQAAGNNAGDSTRKAEDCAHLFIRSSSGTEGLNGWLSVRLLRIHGVRDDWLAALKVVHNYLLRRPDGTTAAQRFYGCAHRDLVVYLCAHLPEPPWPRHRKPKPRFEPSALAM